MKSYYNVPLEQIKEGIDLTDISSFIGYSPYGEFNSNRVKRYDGYYLNLIVEYEHGDCYAKELRTGILIQVCNFYFKENDENEKIKINTHDVHTYIRNPIKVDELGNEESLIFTDQNNILKMDPKKAQEILDTYEYKYTEYELYETLIGLTLKGESILERAEKKLEQNIAAEKKLKNDVIKKLNLLKNQS